MATSNLDAGASVLSDNREHSKKPEISVIVPFYNTGEYLQETLASVGSQSFQNIEVIVVDDGSTDKDSISLIESIDIHQSLILRQANSGPAAARNLAISHARGEYILPLDSDDIIAPTFLEKCINKFKTEDESLGVVYSQTEWFDKRKGLRITPDATPLNMLIANHVVATALFRKSHWEAFGGYKEDFDAGLEDYDFWLCFIANGLRFFRIEEPLFYCRKRQTKTSRSDDLRKEHDGEARMMRKIYENHNTLYAQYAPELAKKLAALNELPFAEENKSLLSFVLGRKKYRLLASDFSKFKDT